MRGPWGELALRAALVLAVFAMAGASYVVFRHVDAREDAAWAAQQVLAEVAARHGDDFAGWAEEVALLRASAESTKVEAAAAEGALLDALEEAYRDAPGSAPPLDKAAARAACARLTVLLGLFDPPPGDPPRAWERDGRGLDAARAGCGRLRGEPVPPRGLVEEVEAVQRAAEEAVGF